MKRLLTLLAALSIISVYTQEFIEFSQNWRKSSSMGISVGATCARITS